MIFAAVKSLGSDDDPPPLEERDDETLMLQYADDGDVDAFEELVSRHEKPVFNFILKRCGQRQLAEELLQETFLRVVRSADSYEPKAKFTTWLYTIARNLCIDRARKEKGPTELSLDKPVGDDPDDDTYVDRMADEEANSASVDHDRRAFRKKLKESLQELPDKQREVFVLREFSELKYREIADVVDAAVPTVKSRMRYALDALRGHLAEYRDHSFDVEERQHVEAKG
ncbi:MAG: RNA polymerase sigma factor [Bradymonadaceae bacterium]